MAPLKRKTDNVADGARPPKKQRPLSTTLVALKEEPAFPRGGASVLTPLEHKQIQIQANQDVLFEQNTGKKAPKHDFEDEENEGELPQSHVNGNAKPRNKTKVRQKKDTSVGATEEKSIRIEGLSYKRLVPGSLVLGQVSQINRYDIGLSLPNNLTGYVPLTSISDTITKRVQASLEDETDAGDEEEIEKAIDLASLFSIGQYLRARVTSTNEDTVVGSKGKRHITLSIEPRQANSGLSKSDLVSNSVVQAVVLSVEDHGVIMDLGLEDASVRGFISSRELGENLEISKLQEGAVFSCLVTGQSSNGKTIKLSTDSTKIGNIKKGGCLSDAPTIDAFLPGVAVDILISEVTTSGIAGKVMGLIDVTADLIHSGAASSGKDLEKKYIVGNRVKGRIICTFPTSEERKLGVSLQDHLLYWREKTVTTESRAEAPSPVALLPVSSVVEEATVVKVESNAGLLMDVGVKGVRGFVHISRISDDKIQSLFQSTGAYKIGSIHKARIIGYNSIDGLFIVSLEPKVINQRYLRFEDVKIGEVVDCSIEKLLVNAEGVSGLIVSVAEGISGLVPQTHLSDVQLQHPERKFKEGMKVTGRVLSKNLERRQMRLTLKKTLVNSDVEPWTTYDNLKAGMQAPGTLINILPSGAVVQFYASIRAFMPVSEMSESFIRDPNEHFRNGQSVNVHIVSVDVEEKRMIVSCKSSSAFGSGQQEALGDLKVGAFVSGTVVEKVIDQIVVELEGSSLRATLSTEHLTDGSASKSVSAAKQIRIGQTIKDLVVLQKQEIKQSIRLTSKPNLVKAAREGRLMSAFEDVKEGSDVVGYINNITPMGVFVQFAGDLTALMLKAQLPDEAKPLPSFGMRKHQSVSAKILSVDRDQRRFFLTTRPLVDAKKDTGQSGNSPAHETILSNPIDETSTNTEDFNFGKITKAKINSIKDTQLNVQLADGVQGRIEMSSIFDRWDEISDRKRPLGKFHPKQVLSVRILGMHDSRNHRFLPITHRDKAPVFELTAKQSDLAATDLDTLTLDKVKVGTSWIVYVNNIAGDCLWVNLSPNVRGRIRAMDVSDEISLINDLSKHFPVGSALKAKVSKIDIDNNRLDLTARDGIPSTSMTLNDISKGQILPGRVTKITDRQIMVQLSEHLSGPVHLVDMADDFSKASPHTYQKNQLIRVCVKDIDVPNKKITLSTRASQVLSSSLPVEDPYISSTHQLKLSDVRRGFVKNVAENGLFISLSSCVDAFVRVADLSDLYIKDWKSEYTIDQLVKGKIINLDSTSKRVLMSLKQSHLDKDYKPPLTFDDMRLGQIVTGKVRKVEDFGVFIVIDNSANVSGLCHRSKMSDKASADPRRLYDEGDAVQAKILNINRDKRQISLGLKASYLETVAEVVQSENVVLGSDDSDVDVSGGDDDTHSRLGVTINESDDEEIEQLKSGEVNLDNLHNVDSDIEMQQDEPGGVQVNHVGASQELFTKGSSGLSTGGFDWTGAISNFSDRDSQSETDVEFSAPTKKKRRKVEIKIDRTGDLDANGPQSTADFERLLLGQPNSSLLWLSYMAFQLELGEATKAREIAERALKTIHIREEVEKLNVWVALLNLENTYGSEESLEEVFMRACQYNDSEDIHERLISIYIQSGQHQKADDLFQTAIKKYTQIPALYLNYANFLMTTFNEPDRARALLPRAMQALPTHAHLSLTSQFAQLEFNSPNGEAERGRTIFETLLSQWPKRLDLWIVLLDLEIKQGDSSVVRRLFERVTGSGMKLKARKAKIFYKKWLDYEEKHGDAKGRERVKALAAEYVSGHGKEAG